MQGTSPGQRDTQGIGQEHMEQGLGPRRGDEVGVCFVLMLFVSFCLTNTVDERDVVKKSAK